MSFFTQMFGCTLKTCKSLVNTTTTTNLACVRYASKKASSNTRNSPNTSRPKHRGWRVQDGHYVEKSTILATQRTLRFHPGLYVGIGKNGTLYALEKGKVVVTCEKIDPNTNNNWTSLAYGGREKSVIYKKHFNVIPEPQHDRFILIDTV